MPKRASPRAIELVRSNAAFLHDTQCAGKFAPEVALPPPKARQRTQRLQQRPPASNLAKIALYAPHACNDSRRYAVTLLDLAQGGLPLSVSCPTILHALFIDQHGQIIPNGQGKFRLAVKQRQHGGIGLQRLDVGLPGAFADAGKSSTTAQTCQTALKLCRANTRRTIVLCISSSAR